MLSCIVSLLGLGLLLYFIYFSYLYYQEKPLAKDLPAAIPTMNKEDRVLIFAPHCDDETISSSAVLYDATHTGGQVLVVFMTNGDGFTIAAEEQFKRLFLSAEDYIQSGFTRQAEALAALGTLGLSPSQAIFLGYPDRGLESLWATHWTTADPLTSKYTRSSHSPYANSFEPYAPYAGENVLKNIEEIVINFRPTVVVLPHPNDEHPDHAATYAFVTAVLYKLNLRQDLPLPRRYYYLVHRGDFPIPHGYFPDRPLLPPKPLQTLNSVQWYSYPLNQEAERRKYQATMRYTSQIKVPIMSKLLLSLIRTNELFAEIPIPKIESAASGADLLDDAAWEGSEPLLYTEPLAVNPVGIVETGRRIHAIYGYRQNSAVWLRLKIPSLSESSWNYTLTYTGFAATEQRWSREAHTFSFNPQEPAKNQDGIFFGTDSVIIKIPQQQPPDFFYLQIAARDWWGLTPEETAWYFFKGGR